MNKRVWRFVYDEEVFDTMGSNFVGIVTDGRRFLFFHAQPTEGMDEERCFIYSYLMDMYNRDNEELSYPWTAENDALLLKALNSLDDDSNRFCGENSVFHEFFS